MRDARYLALSCPIAAELGARMVQTYDCEGFAKVVEAFPVPVIIAGGPKLPTEHGVFQPAFDAISRERTEVKRAKADDYALIVWCKRMPADFVEVERDTQTVARALLKELGELNVLPAAAPLCVVVRGRMPKKGETGKQLVRVFGVSRDDSQSDQVSFERNK